MTVVVPELRGPDPGTGAAIRPRPKAGLRATSWGLSRRSLLQAATALGMTVLSVFPAARRAYAGGYQIYTGPCPSYAADHDCSPGCGPSTIFAGACRTGGARVGFHRNDGVSWKLRPNQCFAGTYDGWLWRYQGACGACACSVERRCHDGYKKTSSGWVKSICRWNTECGCLSRVSWPTERRGDTGVNVYAVQHLLTYHGYRTARDGIFGPHTETRVKEFEAAHGLTVDGVVGPSTWRALVVRVRRGDRGHPVRAAQRELNKYAYGLAVDGVFGPLTEAAVRDFERQNGLTVDGIVGRRTWRTLTGGAV